MITIIFGPPRIGKTAFMVYLLNKIAYDEARNRMMQNVIMSKNIYDGYNLTIPEHCASANFEILFRKQGRKPRHARVIDPNRLGFANADVKTHFILPYETFGIMEAQQYYNSRKFKEFPEWKSNLFEQHGHNHLDFLLDTQRPGLIDVNIRELSNFIEIRNLEVEYGRDGFFNNMTWTIREFEAVGLVDEYMKSGKRDTSLFTEKRVISERNVLNQYNSFSLESRFYDGHNGEDFDLAYSKQYLEDIKTAVA